VNERHDVLRSWRSGATRDAVVGFLDAVTDIPVTDRLACFDNDGTLWCERPNFPQLEFFVDALQTRVIEDPTLAAVPAFAAVLSGDAHAIGAVGLERVALALASMYDGSRPDKFTATCREYISRAVHPTLGRPMRSIVYQPMLELLDELRRLEFTIGIVTGGGTEFVRAISHDLYGVSPESVIGTLIGYEFTRADDERPVLRRTAALTASANEGAAKVINIQSQWGRQPILAGGNSGGDREMLEWACAGDGPRLAILIDHDDEAREFRYVSKAQTFAESERITDIGSRLAWTIVSMANDWSTIFPPVP
jgi:hypothetical protein